MGWLKKIFSAIFAIFGFGQTKYKTGMSCVQEGGYKFHSYLDGSTKPSPTIRETIIPLDKGDRFPPINSVDKGCYWVKMKI